MKKRKGLEGKPSPTSLRVKYIIHPIDYSYINNPSQGRNFKNIPTNLPDSPRLRASACKKGS
ncbi:hypothetical protein PN473_11445, partial [Dolichospermum circinale CS-545/17]|nr:hypothetical protein [Dolichospermum circinale CS-545/17]